MLSLLLKMFRRSGLIFSALLLFISCAQPKYEIVETTNNENPVEQMGLSQCSARFEKTGYCLLWRWEKKPQSTSDDGILAFKVVRPNQLDGSSIPVDLLDLKDHPAAAFDVVLWMNSMGHGSVPTQVERVDVGSYRVRNVIFIMKGDWEISFRLMNQGNLEDRTKIDLIISFENL